MEYDETVIVESSMPINTPFNIMTLDVETNSESTFEVNDTRKDLIEEIKLTTLTLTINMPTDADFSFLESINVFISAEDLEEVEIAFKDSIPEDIGNSINLETIRIDIKEYIKKDNFNLRLSTVTDEILTRDHEIDVHSVFYVDAKILGL